MSSIIFRNIVELASNININRTYSKRFKCKVIISVEETFNFMPNLNIFRREYRCNLWEYVKIKDSVYRKILLGSKLCYRLEDMQLFLERVLDNNCNFDGINLYVKSKGFDSNQHTQEKT